MLNQLHVPKDKCLKRLQSGLGKGTDLVVVKTIELKNSRHAPIHQHCVDIDMFRTESVSRVLHFQLK